MEHESQMQKQRGIDCALAPGKQLPCTEQSKHDWVEHLLRAHLSGSSSDISL